jgi:CBS domain containing-hemolysin-like protein
MTPDPSTWLLIVMTIVVCNAFFVAAEFALVKVRLSQLEVEVRNGKRGSKLVYHIVQNLNQYLSGIQLWITLTSLLLGWVGEPAIAHGLERFLLNLWFDVPDALIHTISFGIALFTISLLHIVLGEQIPKLIAIRHPMRISYFVAQPLRGFQFIGFPFIWLFDSLTQIVMRLLKIEGNGHNDLHSEEEIKLLLTESEEGGVIAESSNELIQNVFEFDDQTVRQIYIPRSRVYAINIDDEFEKHFETIVKEGYSRIPVYRNNLDDIVGVVYLKDFLPALKNHGTVDFHKLTRPVHFVPQNQKIEQLLKDFQRLHIQMAIVTNEHGETAGIVTLEDIVEELVWEIQDEHDTEEEIVIEKRPGTYIVRTESTIDDANDFLPIPLPESPEYDTVSGFINTIFGRIPNAGETIDYGDYDITVLRRGKNTVELVKMQIQK